MFVSRSLDHRHLRTSTNMVSFSSISPEQPPTIALCDYSPEEIQATWYSSKEYEKMSLSCQKQVHMMQVGRRRLKDKKYCERGLEIHLNNEENESSSSSSSRIQVRKLSIQARAQQLCDDHQRLDSNETIATVHRRITLRCQEDANEFGISDQQAAIKTYSHREKMFLNKQEEEHQSTELCVSDAARWNKNNHAQKRLNSDKSTHDREN